MTDSGMTADTVVIAGKGLQNKGAGKRPHGRESIIQDKHWKAICGRCGGEATLLQRMGVEDKRKQTGKT